MNIKEIAIQCGTEFTQYKQVNFTYEFTPSQLEQFAQAIIKSYVAEQKPAAWKGLSNGLETKWIDINDTEYSQWKYDNVQIAYA